MVAPLVSILLIFVVFCSILTIKLNRTSVYWTRIRIPDLPALEPHSPPTVIIDLTDPVPVPVAAAPVVIPRDYTLDLNEVS